MVRKIRLQTKSVSNMPYASEAQRKFFHANKAKLESQGVNVGEWDRASAGKHLPAKVKPRSSKAAVKKVRKTAKKR